MPSEIRQLLEQIEAEHLAARRGLSGLASVARHDFINARYQAIDQCHNRLQELVGTGATKLVAEIIEAADLLYDCQQERERLRETEV